MFSLDAQERARTKKALDGIAGAANVQCVGLQRSTLIGYEISHPPPDVAVLVHFCEGRVLLTDQDGLYNDFMRDAVTKCNGQVVVVLTNVEGTPADALANPAIVSALADEATGAQSSVQELHAQHRLLTWQRQPSEKQLQHLKDLVTGRAAPLELPQSLLDHCTPQRRRICMLL
mgnify:CR=1 FL=1